MPTQPHILYQNPSATVTLIDIPRSIEVAQGATSRKLISTKPLGHPFPSLEPKSEKAKRNVGETSLDDLLIQKHLEFALQEIEANFSGDWCLPRVVDEGDGVLKDKDGAGKKRKGSEISTTDITKVTSRLKTCTLLQEVSPTSIFHSNYSSSPTTVTQKLTKFYIPPLSTLLQADILTSRDQLILETPEFSLIILDPPWPNRSARRKNSYQLSHDPDDIETLLTAVPVATKLANDGIVAVWITNKPSFRDLVLGEEGLFAQWGVSFVEEWVWLKVTRGGEPICALDSTWRRPWEVLLVGRKGDRGEGEGVKRRVIVGVPDLHSRKPNLKTLFEVFLGRRGGEYEALEVFSRNLTEGWWSWGNEVLRFQGEEYWVDGKE
jgi:N6-adenosine-specific RNA methylase IME4